ncbi:MAG TPA: hypothetical protein VFJ06_13355 [Halococcus sp.]|nr:hypothetical protein [Halococcus sp.]
MTESTIDAADSTTSEECCPICGEPVVDSPYPRHRLVLEDESDANPNQRHERRVCPACWDDLCEVLDALV